MIGYLERRNELPVSPFDATVVRRRADRWRETRLAKVRSHGGACSFYLHLPHSGHSFSLSLMSGLMYLFRSNVGSARECKENRAAHISSAFSLREYAYLYAIYYVYTYMRNIYVYITFVTKSPRRLYLASVASFLYLTWCQGTAFAYCLFIL